MPGLARLRFLTTHPRDMSDRLIAAVAELDKVCPAINLPVQAGDDEVLRGMGRGYTVEDTAGWWSGCAGRIPGWL